MAARKVQSYLDQHRIGPLFEDLMAKLIKDMPNQPVPYLIKVLRKIAPDEADKGSLGRPPSGNRSMSPLSRSQGLSGTPMTRRSLDESKDYRGRSTLAKSWAAPDPHDPYKDHTKGREYDRPWMTNSKSGRAATDNTRTGSGKTKRHAEHGSWNPDTHVPTHDFDELFQMQSNPSMEHDRADLRDGMQSWNEDDLQDKRALGYPLHIKRASQAVAVTTDDDGLKGEELHLRTDVRTRGDSSDSGVSVSSYGSGRSHKSLNARTAAEEHRRQLQALLMDNTSDGRNRQGGVAKDDSDEGTEILENADELVSEGVDKITKSGAKLIKSSRSESASKDSVKVSICARCARVISGIPGDLLSDAGSTFSANNDDDNFESVSQVGSVTGEPARVTWPAGFDTDGEPTPRQGRGKHMWQSSSPKPEKGRHMYRGSSFPSNARGSPGPRPSSSASERSDNGLFSKPGASRTWNYDGYSSDNEGGDTYRVSSPNVGESRPWTRPPPDSASEAGSATWERGTTNRKKEVTFKSKGFRRYQGNLSDSDN